MSRKAVILFSGGLDSTTTLAIARDQGYALYALSVRYGQKHDAELDAAGKIAGRMGVVEHRVMRLEMDLSGSALTSPDIAVPATPVEGIPITYVPARNTMLLSMALGWAEVIDSTNLFIGVNAVDYSGYPDCRPEFIAAYEAMARTATRAAVENNRYIKIHTPLIELSKAEIITRGLRLGVNYADTVSCYQADPEGRACGQCDACRFRRQGFEQAGVPDPTRYAL